MSFVPTGKWADVGNGILLRTDQKKYIAAKDLLVSLREYDMMEIKLLHPENHPVAVDTGVKPRIIKQANRHSVVLLAQISTLQRFPKMLQMRCNCFDEINNDWALATKHRMEPHYESVPAYSPSKILALRRRIWMQLLQIFLPRCIQGKPLQNSFRAWRGHFYLLFIKSLA